jgi:hypothetical protein
MSTNPDGKFVVVRQNDNARISGNLHENRSDAEGEVKRLTEGVTAPSGGVPPEFKVVQVVNG